MKNWYKNQKGSMAVYVTITILCFIFILTGLFLSSASIRKGQLRTIVEIVEAYQKDNDRVEEIYIERESKDAPSTVEEAVRRNYIFNTTKTLLDSNKKEVTIPAGFKIVQNGVNNTEYANPASPTVDDGIVITDTTGNEFVWVPVFEETPIYKTNSEGKNIGLLYDFGIYSLEKSDTGHHEPDTLSYYDDIEIYKKILGVDSSADFKIQLQKEFDFLVASVNKYKGFYIGRYETGNLKEDKENIPVVQKGRTDINNVNWYYQYQTSKNISLKNADKRVQNSVTSSMIWGSQWDAVMNWFLNSKDAETKGYVTNSAKMGWYSDNSNGRPQATGTPIVENGKVKNRVKNIYDMAGNVADWTIESYSNDRRDTYGMNYKFDGSIFPAGFRNGEYPDFVMDRLWFSLRFNSKFVRC